MTVEVDTPAGLKAGSSVVEVTAAREMFRTSETGEGGGGIRGEAVVVDLPDSPLFALLKLPDAKGELSGYVTQALAGGDRFRDFNDYFAAVRKLGGWFHSAKAELPREDWPMMVRFRDISDAKSVERVDPDTAGVKRILLETTKDELTAGIENRMPPWFKRLADEKARLNGNTSIAVMTNDLADNLGPGSFSTQIR
jgi:hypothetical protein